MSAGGKTSLTGDRTLTEWTSVSFSPFSHYLNIYILLFSFIGRLNAVALTVRRLNEAHNHRVERTVVCVCQMGTMNSLL